MKPRDEKSTFYLLKILNSLTKSKYFRMELGTKEGAIPQLFTVLRNATNDYSKEKMLLCLCNLSADKENGRRIIEHGLNDLSALFASPQSSRRLITPLITILQNLSNCPNDFPCVKCANILSICCTFDIKVKWKRIKASLQD